MSRIWDRDHDLETEFDAHWTEIATQVRTQAARDLEWRAAGYHGVQAWIASALTVALAILASWAFWNMGW
jgi:hypothetical protein